MAYAVETGYDQSSYASANYTLSYPAAAVPVLSLGSGSYSGLQTVTITDTAPGATIYYTTNGSLPNTNSAQYTGPITIATSETLAASATGYGYAMSAPASAQYFISSSSSSFIYSIAGTGLPGYSGDGGAATVAQLNAPSGSVADGAGNVYIADQYNNLVRKVAAGTGIITSIAGNSMPGYSGDGGAATSAQLYSPVSVALDAAGNLYIADSQNNAIRKVTAATGVISTYAGSGQPGYSGDGGAATAAELGDPGGACDRCGGQPLRRPTGH